MTLTELLLSLSIAGLLSGWALPAWQQACNQALLKARAQTLIADTQWAQWQALRLGESIELSPLACAGARSGSVDWSCGWEVIRPNSSGSTSAQVLRHREIQPQIRMTPFMATALANANWRFDAQGRWRMGAMRVEWSIPGRIGSATGMTACVSNTGRWRWQSGLGCGT